MTTVHSRLYTKDENATKVAKDLRKVGFSQTQIDLISKSKPKTASATDETPSFGGASASGETVDSLAAKIRAAGVYATAAMKYAQKLTATNALVVLRAPFGQSGEAIPILNQFETIDAGAKFEEFFGGREASAPNIIRTSGARSIIKRRMSTGKKSTIANKPFFSSKIGMKTIIQPKKKPGNLKRGPIFGQNNLIKPKTHVGRPKNLLSFSSTLGVPLLWRDYRRDV
ncbi:MAG: hypothetical protein AAF850_01115 [Pseudomonadota bacterium]